jgi:hypothetical protein
MKLDQVQLSKLFFAFIWLSFATLRTLNLDFNNPYWSFWYDIPFHLYALGLFFLIWAFVPGKKKQKQE